MNILTKSQNVRRLSNGKAKLIINSKSDQLLKSIKTSEYAEVNREIEHVIEETFQNNFSQRLYKFER